MAAAEAICAGHDVVLVAGAECQTTVKAREGGEYLARAAHYKEERPIDDFTFPALFARRIKAYHEKYGLDLSELGYFTMKAMENARKNPLAHMKANKWDLKSASTAGDHNPNFLGNEELSPLHDSGEAVTEVRRLEASLIVLSKEKVHQRRRLRLWTCMLRGVAAAQHFFRYLNRLIQAKVTSKTTSTSN